MQYGSGYVGLYNLGSSGQHGSGISGPMKVGRELVGEWISSWVSSLFRTAWHAPEDPVSRKDGCEKGSSLVWFRLSMSDEGGLRGGD